MLYGAGANRLVIGFTLSLSSFLTRYGRSRTRHLRPSLRLVRAGSLILEATRGATNVLRQHYPRCSGGSRVQGATASSYRSGGHSKHHISDYTQTLGQEPGRSLCKVLRSKFIGIFDVGVLRYCSASGLKEDLLECNR